VQINIYFDVPVKKLPTGTAIPKFYIKTITFYKAKKILKYRFPNTVCKGKLEEYIIQ
jgi:hypothetical protein